MRSWPNWTPYDPDGRVIERYLHFVLRHRILYMIGFFVATLAFLPHFSNLEVINRTSMWFKDDDPHYARYRQLIEEFGNDHVLIVAVHSPRLISLEMLEYLDTISERIRDVEGVTRVSGLTSLLHRTPPSSLPGFRMPAITIPFPHNERQLNDVNQFLSEQSIFREFFVSDDGQATQLVVRVSQEGSQVLRNEIVQQVHRIVQMGRPPETDVWLTGPLFLGTELDRYTRESGFRVVIVAGLSMLVLLFLFLRSIPHTLTVFGTSLVATLWAMGFYLAMGNIVNLMTNIIIPITLVMSVADGVHIIKRYRQEVAEKNEDRAQIIVRAVARIWLPCLLTTLTTMIGFASLTVSPVSALGEFGLYAAAAMLFTFVLSIHLIPIALSFFSTAPAAARPAPERRSLGIIASIAIGRPVGVIIGFALLVVVASYGVSLLRVDTNQIDLFPEDSELSVAARFIDEHFGGINPVQVVIRGKRPEILLDPRFLGTIHAYEQIVERDFQLRKTPSLPDLAAEINASLGRDREIPQSRERVKGVFALLSWSDAGKELLRTLTDEEFQQTVITFRMHSDVSTGQILEIVSSLDLMTRQYFQDQEVSVELTGIIPLYAYLSGYLVRTLALSFLIAFGATLLLVGGLFLSLPALGAVGVVNVVPIALTLGIMGFFDVYIDSATAMIASIAFGIIVDDTIHLIFREREEADSTSSFRVAMERTLQGVGPALITTSLVIGLGCLTLALSSFRPIRNFGLMIAIAILTALLTDLLLLPAILSKLKGPITRG